MSVSKLFNLFALSSLAVLVCSFGATPVTALSTGDNHLHRVVRSHGAIAKAKRNVKRSSTGKRCKSRPTAPGGAPAEAAAPAPKPAKTTTTTGHHHSTTTSSGGAPTKPSTTPKSTPPPTNNNDDNNNSGGGGGNPGAHFGLAWANGDVSWLKNFVAGHTGHIYTWGPQGPSNRQGLTFMPMLWSDAGNKVAEFQKLVKPGYANVAMGFNECNEPGQSNMSPERAAAAWKKYLEPLVAHGYKLVSPSTSSNPNGYTWMQNFFKACNGGCTVSYMSLHYYDVTFSGFQAYAEKWHNGFGRPIMFTEYACQNFNGGAQCNSGQVWSFHQQVNDFCKNTPWIVTCMPFGVMNDMQGVNGLNKLLSNNVPNALGSSYVHQTF